MKQAKPFPDLSPDISGNESGQAVTEYILLLMTVIGFYAILANFMTTSGLANKLTSPIMVNYKYAYQYGSTQARGYGDPGGPVDHPRIHEANNFRIFINPSAGADGAGD